MKKLLSLSIITSLIFLNFSTLNAKASFVESDYVPMQYIKPFGDFSWNDNFVQTITKLQKIEGIDNINILDVYRDKVKDITNLKGEQLIEAIYKQIEEDGNLKYVHKYLDKNGASKNYFPWSIKISGSPIIISNIPFEIILTFENLPAVDLLMPNNVFSYNNIAFPLFLKEIMIKSISYDLLEENKHLLFNLFCNKYDGYTRRENGFRVNRNRCPMILNINRLFVNDEENHGIQAGTAPIDNQFYIIYENYESENLKMLYKKHANRIKMNFYNKNKTIMDSKI